MAVGPFTITAERMSVIDFTKPFMTDGGGILTKKVEPIVNFSNVFRPFSLNLWVTLGAAVLITGTTLCVFSKAQRWRHCVQGQHQEVHATEMTLSWFLFLVLGALMGQGTNALSNSKCHEALPPNKHPTE